MEKCTLYNQHHRERPCAQKQPVLKQRLCPLARVQTCVQQISFWRARLRSDIVFPSRCQRQRHENGLYSATCFQSKGCASVINLYNQGRNNLCWPGFGVCKSHHHQICNQTHGRRAFCTGKCLHCNMMWTSKASYQVKFHISASPHLLPLFLLFCEVIIFVLCHQGQV